ncbi:MAG TPA: hypothetical protein VG056_04420 [Pirellulales bacterium]|nr:hypothetical protein [Pirellulales bacterium]
MRGKKLSAIKPVLARVGRGSVLPHWYQNLKQNGTLPNLDGKTIGSVVEMLLVGVLETSILAGLGVPPLRINPARGVDLPDLDLGVKSPSENYCTSEPFFSAYERLLGGECDILVLLTDYQSKKDTPPLRLQIIKWRYLTKTQVADSSLCAIARKHRDWLIADSEATAQRLCRFLAYINQSDWRGKFILRMIDAMQSEDEVKKLIEAARRDFVVKNKKAAKKDKPLIPDSDLEAIQRIGTIAPCHVGVIEAADNWVIEIWKDAARSPSADEWNRLKSGSLDGQIGMSFALQWRYNFGRLFGVEACDVEPALPSG